MEFILSMTTRFFNSFRMTCEGFRMIGKELRIVHVRFITIADEWICKNTLHLTKELPLLYLSVSYIIYLVMMMSKPVIFKSTTTRIAMTRTAIMIPNASPCPTFN